MLSSLYKKRFHLLELGTAFGRVVQVRACWLVSFDGHVSASTHNARQAHPLRRNDHWRKRSRCASVMVEAAAAASVAVLKPIAAD